MVTCSLWYPWLLPHCSQLNITTVDKTPAKYKLSCSEAVLHWEKEDGADLLVGRIR